MVEMLCHHRTDRCFIGRTPVALPSFWSAPLSNRPIADRPACPEFGDKTELARVTPGSKQGFIREYFECAKCDRLWKWEVPDPVQHATTLWSFASGTPPHPAHYTARTVPWPGYRFPKGCFISREVWRLETQESDGRSHSAHCGHSRRRHFERLPAAGSSCSARIPTATRSVDYDP
jgi:hypothetical protein